MPTDAVKSSVVLAASVEANPAARVFDPSGAGKAKDRALLVTIRRLLADILPQAIRYSLILLAIFTVFAILIILRAFLYLS